MQESVQLISDLATSEAAYTGTAKLMTEVMSRDTVLDSVTKLVVQGSWNAWEDEGAYAQLLRTCENSVYHPRVKDRFYEQWVRGSLPPWLRGK